MPLTCREFTGMLADAADLASGGDALADHARTCADCARYAARVARIGAALRELTPMAAPAELEGRAVAAFEAGHRSDRAVAALRTLGRREAPASLDAAVARAAGEPAVPRAPEVLRRLVVEELSDPRKATARRFVGSLPRTSAPEALYDGVGGQLQRRRSARPGRAWLITTGAVLLSALLVGGWLMRREPTAAGKPSGKIVWVRVDSAKDLSPMTRALMAGFTGGASELGELDGGR